MDKLEQLDRNGLLKLCGQLLQEKLERKEKDEQLIRDGSHSVTEQKKQQKFNLTHLEKITPKTCEWVDHSYNIPFTGRNEFFKYVARELRILSPQASPDQQCDGGENYEDNKLDDTINVTIPTKLSRTETAPISNRPRNNKESFSIVYSSVSGSGKTVSMLQLKEKLPRNTKDGSPIVVSYLGFNSGLDLTNDEFSRIENYGRNGAEEVLARRLVASTIISHHNSQVKWSFLPSANNVYNCFIPSVSDSLKVLREYMVKNHVDSISIVAGVDEVQVLNNLLNFGPEKIGLGRFFLRTLRKWQVKLNRGDEEGKGKIYLLPLGTGIELDWTEDQSLGRNTRISGSDATLISKADFKELTKKIVQELKENKEFHSRFGNATEDTIVENVSAMYWPRVRLLQWFRENKTFMITDQDRDDANHGVWNKWISRWMLCESVNLDSESGLAPGKGETGKIKALFQLSTEREVFIIPDGYAALSILKCLGEVSSLKMPVVYGRIGSKFQSLDPNWLVVGDEYSFEEMGFDVVTLAIHVGLYTISERRNKCLSLQSASEEQKLRLGLALWFADHGALPDTDLKKEFPAPTILGQGTISETTNYYYPFKDSNQKELLEDVKREFCKNEQDAKPLYIRAGKNTCCDYLHFFLKRTAGQRKSEWICTICDAKHSIDNSTNISGDDQKSLYDAAININAAISDMNHTITDIRLVFLTNKKVKADSKIKGLVKSKNAVEKLWSKNVELELLNEDTFDCGPFSDVLMARRHHSRKRKRESST